MASYLVYNGIALDVMRTVTYSQEPEIVNGDYIGIRVVIEVECIYNPQAISYIIANVNGIPNVVRINGHKAPETSVAIDRYLSVPRADLLYVIGNTIIIQSPGKSANNEDYKTDILAGPTPLSVSVKPGLTERTWKVTFKVSTIISDCNPIAPGLISNRWTQTHIVGADHLTTVITEGVSIFRTDVLMSLNKTADYFRSVCLPPFLYDFQRVETIVRLNEIGNALTWKVTDRERAVSIGAETGRAYGVIDFQANVTFSTPSTGDPVTGIAMPIVIGQFVGMARGNRNSSRKGLFAWLSRLASERMNIPPPGMPVLPDTPIKVSVQGSEAIDMPVVTLAITARYASAQNQFGHPGADPTINNYLGIDILPLFLEGVTTGTNPQLPRGARGHYAGAAFAQELRSVLESCSPPSSPREITVDQVKDYSVFDANGNKGITRDTYLANSKSVVDVSVGYPLPSPTGKTKRSANVGTIGLQEQKSSIKYETKSNIVVAPVASDEPQEPLVFQLSQPISFRKAVWSTERIGAKPKIPHAKSGDPKEATVSSEVRFSTPIIGPDMQSPIYRAEGSSVWAYTGKGTKGPGDSELRMGSHPWIDDNYDSPENTILEDDYIKDESWVAPPVYDSYQGETAPPLPPPLR